MKSELFPYFIVALLIPLGLKARPQKWGKICLLLFFLGTPAFAGFSSDEAASLETKIWTEPESLLENYEAQATRLIQIDPYSDFAHYLLGQLYLRQFRENPSQLKLLKQASELGQQAIELSPEKDYGYIIASQVLDIMGYGQNAIGILEGDEQVKLQPSWRTAFLKAQLIAGQRGNDEALDEFEAALRQAGSLKEVVVPHYISALKGSYSGVELLEKLKEKGSLYEHRLFDFYRAAAYAERDDFKAAHAIYQSLQKTNPDFTEAAVQDAIILYKHLGKPKDARSTFSKLLSGKISSTERSHINAHLGSLLLNEEKTSVNSQQYFAEAIVEGPNPMEWVVFSHREYEKKNRLQDFVLLLDQIKSRIPPSAYLYALQGEVQSENLSQHARAIESFRSAITLDPERSEFYNGLGLTYYRMNDYSEALKTFLEAIKVDPQDATSRYNHACVLAILGRQDEALGSLREAIGLDPRLQQMARNDKDFEKLRETQGFRFLTEPRSSAAANTTEP